MTEPDDPLVGTLLAGKYRIRRCLGRGGFGAVYEADHTLLKRRVALKLLHPDVAADEAHLARFHREAQAAANVGHPHIVDVTDMGVLDDGSAYLVLEYLEGRDLRAAIQAEAPFSAGRAARIVSMVCDALSAAHELGIVHRDLKPENVYLVARGGDPDFVKVLDFGVAKVLDGPLKEETMTATGTAIGTISYMAPEQARGDKGVDLRADLYAVGVMLHELLVGERPFGRIKPVETLYKLCFEVPPRVRARRPDVPEALDALVAQLLEKDAEDRPATAEAVRDALAPYLAVDAPPRLEGAPPKVDPLEATAPARPSAPAPKTAPLPAPAEVPATEEIAQAPRTEVLAGPSPRGRPLLVAAGLALVAALAGAALLAAGREPETEVPLPAPRPSPEQTVHVVIEVTPRAAELRLDGEPVANPFEGDIPVREAPHELVAELAGYVTATREVSLRRAQSVRFALAPVDGGAPEPPATEVAASRTRRRGARAAGEPVAPTQGSEEPREAEAAPSEEPPSTHERRLKRVPF